MDIVIPKNILRELFYGVVYYISDPQTFASFSLANSECWKVACEYIPMKKKEFTITVESPLFIYRKLPNGALHGWIEPTAINRFSPTDVYNTSLFVSQLNRDKSCTNTRPPIINAYIYGKLLVEKDKYGVCWTNISNPGDLYVPNTVRAFKCPLCMKYHYFIAKNYWILSGKCFDTKLTKKTLNRGKIDYYIRRLKISRSILDYSKSIKLALQTDE